MKKLNVTFKECQTLLSIMQKLKNTSHNMTTLHENFARLHREMFTEKLRSEILSCINVMIYGLHAAYLKRGWLKNIDTHHCFSSDCVWEKCFLGQCVSWDEAAISRTASGAKIVSQPITIPGGLCLCSMYQHKDCQYLSKKSLDLNIKDEIVKVRALSNKDANTVQHYQVSVK